MAQKQVQPACIPDRIMVCMSSNVEAPRVIRKGARMAERLNARWYAVYVEIPNEQPRRLSPKARDALAKNIALAESLGATVVRVKAARPAEGLIAKRRDRVGSCCGEGQRSTNF